MLSFKKDFIMQLLKCLCLILLMKDIYCNYGNDSSVEEFIPSHEWQVVKPGQSIPPGLHIRSNLQTGITEAKFLDKDDKSDANGAVALAQDPDNTANNTKESYSPDQLKRMLKNVKDDGPAKKDNIEINGTKFRSYEELKKDFETLNMSIKTDLEIIRELMDEFQGDVDTNRVIAILGDLEYYLHQIDNAQNFVDMGGLQILHRFINSAERKVQSEALRCLSSAIQGNAKVKVEAMKNGTLARLLVHLKSSSDASTLNQVLVAISALTRQFPIAQLAFINAEGLQISGEIFDRYMVSEDEKIGVRLITLISDWLKERSVEDLEMSSSESNKDLIRERQQQYHKVDLEGALIHNRWCTRFSQIYSTRANRSVDFLEKILTSIGAVYPICRAHLDTVGLHSFLTDASATLARLAATDAEDFYFSDVLRLARDALEAISAHQPRIEL